jgi:endonuclease-3
LKWPKVKEARGKEMNEVTPPTYAGPPPGSPEQVRAILAALRRLYPDAKTSLTFSTPLELLVATILSAQSTDVLVNRVTAELFKKYRRVEDYATVSQEELEKDIQSTGFYHTKAKNIRAAAQRIMTTYGGEVPRRMEDLVTLPGVGRKTANVVLGNAFGIVEGIVVDTHVGRLARRLGWTTNEDPVQVEQDLMRIIPRKDWLDLSHMLIYHGRAICLARKPLCAQCALVQLCPSAFRVS